MAPPVARAVPVPQEEVVEGSNMVVIPEYYIVDK
jgi:hypothetical protein